MTVKELIDKLNKLSPDKIVVIVDVDTYWHLTLLNVEEESDRVTLEGNYRNRVD